jgi:hypothetical protein
MRERPITFGDDDRLMGILTEPPPNRERRDAPTLLTWNVGVHHRVGPHRVFVDLARHLASRGFASLRFDLSGRGDSEARREASSEMESDLVDVREAMAAVAARRGSRFVLLGYGASVDAAHRTAMVDGRVRGACFVEGYAHRTRGFHLRRPFRALEAARWRRLLARRLPRAAKDWPIVRGLARIPLDVAGDADVYARECPPQRQLRRDYALLVARGSRLLFIFAGSDGSYNHRDQLFEFGCSPRQRAAIDLEYYPRADHTLFRPADRAQVVARIGEWMEQRFA